jgi:hypothetical protein
MSSQPDLLPLSPLPSPSSSTLPPRRPVTRSQTKILNRPDNKENTPPPVIHRQHRDAFVREQLGIGAPPPALASPPSPPHPSSVTEIRDVSQAMH